MLAATEFTTYHLQAIIAKPNSLTCCHGQVHQVSTLSGKKKKPLNFTWKVYALVRYIKVNSNKAHSNETAVT